MAYATIEDVKARTTRTLSEAEETVAAALLDDAATIIDATGTSATDEAKKVVSCRMVLRALGDGASDGIPIGATQGSMSGLGYSQSWTIANGASGEVYISKLEKKLLGLGNAIGAYSPLEGLVRTAE